MNVALLQECDRYAWSLLNDKICKGCSQPYCIVAGAKIYNELASSVCTRREHRASPLSYFHNGFAADLDTVVDFYDTRFHIGFSKQDKVDLVAFLRSL